MWLLQNGKPERRLRQRQQQLLAEYDSDNLRKEYNEAILAWGHGDLVMKSGEKKSIGGSKGGGFRLLIGNFENPLEKWQDIDDP